MINSQIPFNKILFGSPRLNLDFNTNSYKELECIHVLGELKGYSDLFENINVQRMLNTIEARHSFELDGQAVSLLRLFEADASENHLEDTLCKDIIQWVHDYDANNINSLKDFLPESLKRKSNEIYRSKQDSLVKSYNTNLTMYTAPVGNQLLKTMRLDLESMVKGVSKQFSFYNLAMLHYQFRLVAPFNALNGVSARLSTQMVLEHHGFVSDPVFLSLSISEDREKYQMMMRDLMNQEDITEFKNFLVNKIQRGAKMKLDLMKRIKKRMIWTADLINKYTEYNLPSELNEVIYESLFIKTADLIGRMNCHRHTAYKYLEHLMKIGILAEKRSGREKLYFHKELYDMISI